MYNYRFLVFCTERKRQRKMGGGGGVGWGGLEMPV